MIQFFGRNFHAYKGHYKWLVLAFGFKKGTNNIAPKMDNFFKYYNFVLVHVDDVLVFNNNYSL